MSDHALIRQSSKGASLDLMAPFFSVVMPVYNAGRYISQTLACLTAQTFADWELVVVDDASTDDGMEIVRALAQDDRRIRIFAHERNQGAPAARNTGIEHVRGAYVWFADADDTFDPDLLQRVADCIARTQADVVMMGLVEDYYDAQGEFLYANELPMEPYESSNPNDWHGRIILYERGTQFGYLWNKIYRASLIRDNGLQLADLRLGEDFFFNADFFAVARSVAVLPGTPFHYRKVEGGSLTNANAYDAIEYYELHRARVARMKELLETWGVFDAEARAVLGSLYVRYVLSALERSYHARESFDAEERAAWFRLIAADPLFDALAPHARSRSSRSLDAATRVVRTRNIAAWKLLGRGMNAARNGAYGLFTKARSGR